MKKRSEKVPSKTNFQEQAVRLLLQTIGIFVMAFALYDYTNNGDGSTRLVFNVVLGLILVLIPYLYLKATRH